MTNRNVSIPNEYDLFDKDGKFVRRERIEVPDYVRVQLYYSDGKYYITHGGWKLQEVACFSADGEELS